ncbi:MAG TPA: hypothetical protein VHQ03_12120, partial [Candidatus Dormibacteraeota bacterium]|nr:hypothetical protein [Candidatus Dormibacteraeota bacterium]
VAGLVLLVLGVGTLRAALRALRGHRWVAGAMRGLAGLLLLALAGLAGAVVVGLREYRALTLEVLAATVTTDPLGPQRFRATILFPDRRLAMYDLAGDALYMDAHILKWHPWVNILGLHTSYELDRVAGRYTEVSDERTKPRTAFQLARPAWVDLFALARRRVLGPLVDAEYGSAAFVAGTTRAQYEVRVSTTGLLIRPVLHPVPELGDSR